MHPYLDLFGLKINIFYFLVCISFVLMSIINTLRAKKYHFHCLFGVLIAFLVNVFAILGAHLLYRIENINNEHIGFGLSFFGTVWFLPIIMTIIGLILKKDIHEFTDYWALTIPMELSIVRIGCYLSGCCLGIIANHGVHFPFDLEGVYRLPVQLYESAFDLLIFMFLLILEKKKKVNGYFYPIFMVLYGFIRFSLEILRDTNKNYFGLSNGQLFALITFFIGLFVIIFKFYKNLKNNNNKYQV